MKLVRQSIYHEGTFRNILITLFRFKKCFKFGGKYWKRVYKSGGVEIYRPLKRDADWLEERMEDYEHYLYRSLAGGVCGKDGQLRHRTRNVYRSSGGYRQRSI